MLKAFKEARRARIARAHPIPRDLWDDCMKSRRIFRGISQDSMARLADLSAAFVAEKKFIAADGADIEDRLRVEVAAMACLPLLGLDLDWYRKLSTIFVTLEGHDVRSTRIDEAGVVHEYDDVFAGEAFDLGPIALSAADIAESGHGDGYNVVIHEMAHHLDGLDGAFDGCPPLHRDMDPGLWRESFSTAYADLGRRLESKLPRRSQRGQHGRGGQGARRVRIDPYAAESPDEFFAVSCEYFFECPGILRGEYPDVYARLAEFFRRSPGTQA